MNRWSFHHRPRPSTLTFHCDSVYFGLTAEQTTALTALAVRSRAALSSAIAAVFMYRLAERSGQRDIVIGSVLAGRTERDFNNVLGFFVNTVVLRARITDTMTFRSLLREVHAKVMGAHDHQHVPFEQVVAAVQPQRDPGRNAIFDVVFAHNGELTEPTGDERGIRRVSLPGASARFDLELETNIVNGMLVGELIYRTDLFDRVTMISIVAGFTRLIEEVIADPRALLSQLSSISDDERRHILADSAGLDARPTTRTLPVAFAGQVARTPEAVALACEGASVSYRELDARSNRLAHVLLAAGAGPDQIVAVLMERSVGFVVTILAVLKTGSAYLPLGVNDPASRLRTVLAESRSVGARRRSGAARASGHPGWHGRGRCD